ncbi:hypothetical protein JJJ17_11625 [Paracoccus caeni]|uniref:Uncharacterized protein n=1 Tax=Paracoccus caeni TaxID=657651 RepID=A0A934SJQ6_9RHOB|nr:hypothetical protein [Paracoccus caeni]MBK4216577.1 hypothetical protein [Paracoccus caeni]
MTRKSLPFLFAMLAYAVVLVISLRILAGGIADPSLRLIISLAPMLPAIAVCLSVLSVIRGLDEMQRRLQLEAFAFAFAGTALVTFGYGFLENVGLPRLSMFVVWPLMAALWGCGVALGGLRYR